jgi:flagellin
MSLVLNTNISSLNAQRNLTTSQASLAQSLQRLSSGLRINSAADDAAGLAISTRFTTQINGTNQAINNANDAVSEAQTAGGALATLTNSLQSIRTLAVEAANGSNSASDRQALDQQVQQQIAEITQIASQTSFNGSNVLDGSSGTTVFQVGANIGNTVSINLTTGVRADQIGQYASATGAAVSTNALSSTNTLTIGDSTGTTVTVGASVAGANTFQSASSAYAKAIAINGAGLQGLTASAQTGVTDGTFVAVTSTAATATYSLSVNGQSIFSNLDVTAATGTSVSASQLVTAVNQNSNITGVTASVSAGKVSFSAADGRDINVVQSSNIAGTVGNTLGLTAAVATNAGVTSKGSLTLTDTNALTIGTVGTGQADAGLTSNSNIALGTVTLASQSVTTVANANKTIAAVDAALQTVSSFNSQLGAIQNRFTAAVSNLTSTAQNLSQSRSTLQDTNFAAETANLTQSNVLEQAGISVLAQANQQPQLILKLLQ